MQWLESFRKPRVILWDQEQVRVISHQAVRDDEHLSLHRVMNKLFKEKTSVLVVEEDISLMVTSLGNMMEKFGHYDPGSSGHATLIDG
jgi:hypothetical protein